MLILIFLLCGVVWLIWRLTADKPEASHSDGKSDPVVVAPATPQRHGQGVDPFPLPRTIESRGLRIIDLRSLPSDMLAEGRFGTTVAVLRTASPVLSHTFVISLATAKAWAALADTSLFIIFKRLKEMRLRDPAIDVLYVAAEADDDEQLDAATVERFAAWGMPVVVGLTINQGNRSITIEQALALPDPFAPVAGTPRPVVPHTLHGMELLWQDVVVETRELVFVDFRRAPPQAIADGAALKTVAALLPKLDPDGTKRWLWVIAPWIAESWQAHDRENDVLALVTQAMARHAGPRHHLSITGNGATGNELIVQILSRVGMLPPPTSINVTTEAGTWSVPPIFVLGDIACAHAVKRYEPRHATS